MVVPVRLFTLVVTYISAASAVHICGNYCGPTWCNGQAIDEAVCSDRFVSLPVLFGDKT
jgi:hypothetical protein